MFWDVTFEDIKTKIRLYIGERQAQVVQQFQTLERVVSLAFGEPEKAKPPEIQSKDELKAKFAAVFGGG